MKCYAIYDAGVIESLQRTSGALSDGQEITQEEYDEIISMIHNKPEPPDGYDYRLLADLTWELYELPVVEADPDEEITDDEALNIILGGE